MSPDKKVELFYDAYRRHPEARVGTVVQRINRLERAEELRKETDRPSPRGIVKFIRLVTGRA
ncbi:hypothetical protein CO661_14000 [Sinorhizobium fredii]|uniref:Uncharacterized protein n=1 Tax=Rhizobium fredii TaxID=380 RepID=A0A2A6LYB7_RHIFR|nr:hypothetical protein [Sinorhizobium fredii]PDT47290.1 hypothetical protein CO661_14000 [Sinorhizobium fredii]